MPRVKKLWRHKRYGKGWTGNYVEVKDSKGKYQRVFLLEKEKRETKQYGSFQAAVDKGWKQ